MFKNHNKQEQIKYISDDNYFPKKYIELTTADLDTIKNPDKVMESIQKQKNDYEQRMLNLELTYIMLNDPVQQLVFVDIIQKNAFSNIQLKFIKDFVCQFSIFKNNQKLNEQSQELDVKLLLRHLKLEKFDKRQVIFEYGELGQKYYMLLKGKVLLFIPKGIENDTQTQYVKVNQLSEEEQYYKKKFPNMFNKKKIIPGESFGEISLLTNQTRTATMVCGEESWLLTLNKEGFDKLIGHIHTQQDLKNTQFLQKFEMIQCLSNNKVHSMLHNITTQKYNYNNIIYTEGQEADKIYFIKSGVVEISKLSLIQETNQTIPNIQEEFESDISKMSQTLQSSQKLQRLYSLNRNNKINDKMQKYKRVKIAILTENSYFGHQEANQDIDTNHTQTRKYQAKCISEELELMVIQKKILLQYLSNSKDGLQVFFSTQQRQIQWKDQNLKEQIKILSLVKQQNLRSRKSESSFQSFQCNSYNNFEQNFPELDEESSSKLNAQQKRQFYLTRRDQNNTLTKNYSLKSFSQETSASNQGKLFELSERKSLRNNMSMFFAKQNKTQEYDQNYPQMLLKTQQNYSNDERSTKKIHTNLQSLEGHDFYNPDKLEKTTSLFCQTNDKNIKHQAQKSNIFKFTEGEQIDTSLHATASPNQNDKKKNSIQIKDFLNNENQTTKETISYQNNSLQEEEEEVDGQVQKSIHNKSQIDQRKLIKSCSFKQKFKALNISNCNPIKSNSQIYQQQEPCDQIVSPLEIQNNLKTTYLQRKKSNFSSSDQSTPQTNRKQDLLQSISQIGKQHKQQLQETIILVDSIHFDSSITSTQQNTNKDYFTVSKNYGYISDRRTGNTNINTTTTNYDSDISKDSPQKAISPYYFYTTTTKKQNIKQINSNRHQSQQFQNPSAQLSYYYNKNKSIIETNNLDQHQNNTQSPQSVQILKSQSQIQQDINSQQVFGDFKQYYAKNLYYITSLKEQIFETISKQSPPQNRQGLFYDIDLDLKNSHNIKKQKLDEKFGLTLREDPQISFQQSQCQNNSIQQAKVKNSFSINKNQSSQHQCENQKKEKIFSDVVTQNIKCNVIKNRKTMFHIQLKDSIQEINNNQLQDYSQLKASDQQCQQQINQLSQFPILYDNTKKLLDKQKIFPQTARLNLQNIEIAQHKQNFSKSPR
ncbi:cyclic nucleotide-binding domain protein (macronuclear) [Tetrahymena thermophila SB210]|uniref:Cyclic nucleotide-binding domain protein n=1 Tax=Tetrahymena thermophila (strain SB210) TaxID=312017 RepID=Q232Z8_TETTS|nr:cyclic nucleotide-binding domain protein [Tetrahymena thermophila SB210]EAR91682.2 cyclic nucleotide-binding domain protein [Tetrahymena thermophila SB210]|eukprot:XP_001011927.2 cyclic nucleotide-binding domain protein [Tetrahymena thermophila SB210]